MSSFTPSLSIETPYRFQGRKIWVLDGGTGNELFRLGLPDTKQMWSAYAIVHEEKYGNLVTKSHSNFINSGCQIITTNGYSLKNHVLKPLKLADNIPKYIKKSIKLAENALKECNVKNDKVLIAGCIPPLITYRADIILKDDFNVRMNKEYNEIISCLNNEIINVFLCETISTFKEAKCVMKIVGNLGINKALFVSFTVDNKGNLRSNESLNDVINKLVKTNKECLINNGLIGLKCILLNCSSPENISKSLSLINSKSVELLSNNNILFGVYPNLLSPDDSDYNNFIINDTNSGEIRDDFNSIIYWNTLKEWLSKYKFLSVIGGCCGVFPSHLKYVTQQLLKKSKL